jgi:hypothetical protein
VINVTSNVNIPMFSSLYKEDKNSNMKDLRKESEIRKGVPEKLYDIVKSITGFNAYSELGADLKTKELKDISRYCEILGGNRVEVEKVLREKGRPFEIYDETFTKRCLVCNALRNYCCC